MSMDDLEKAARWVVDANAAIDAATNAYERFDATEAAKPAWEDLGAYAQDIVDLVARVRAAEPAEVAHAN